ncbi:hypothetical protein ABZP36_033861 [Zizania latifolia]
MGYDFYQAEALGLEKTVLDTVAQAAEDWKIDDSKGLLGRCNFRDDMLDRKVPFLRGGEKKAISEYTGTVIRVIEVNDQTIQDYLQGDYNVMQSVLTYRAIAMIVGILISVMIQHSEVRSLEVCRVVAAPPMWPAWPLCGPPQAPATPAMAAPPERRGSMKLIRRVKGSKAKKGSSVGLQPREKIAANLEGGAGSNNRQVVPESPDDIPFGAAGHGNVGTLESSDWTIICTAGSREEVFFEACPWFESDCEDEFFSVNGDVTPARSFRTASSSSNQAAVPPGPCKLQTLGSILRAEALKRQQQQQHPPPSPPQVKLADLLCERQESFAYDHYAGFGVSRNSSLAGEQAARRCCMPSFVSYTGRRRRK